MTLPMTVTGTLLTARLILQFNCLLNPAFLRLNPNHLVPACLIADRFLAYQTSDNQPYDAVAGIAEPLSDALSMLKKNNDYHLP